VSERVVLMRIKREVSIQCPPSQAPEMLSNNGKKVEHPLSLLLKNDAKLILLTSYT